MTKHTQHFDNCNAPICAEDDTPNWEKNVIWYPGEEVCKRRPWTKWQKRQLQINKWLAKGEFLHPERCFTVEALMRGRSLYKGRRGLNPDDNIH